MSDNLNLRAVEEALIEVVSAEVEPPYQAEIKAAVEKFFEEVVSKYAKDELEEKLGNMETVLADFSNFLDSTSCVICPKK
jgi:hypothetical protein